MKKTSVALSLTLDLNTNDNLSQEEIEHLAYWVVQPLLEQAQSYTFDNGTTIEGFSLNVEKQPNISVPSYAAEQIVLEDDEQPTGGVAFVGETLDDFIQVERDAFAEYGVVMEDDEFIYDIPLEVVNKALEECGIKKLTILDIELATDKAADEIAAQESGACLFEVKGNC